MSANSCALSGFVTLSQILKPAGNTRNAQHMSLLHVPAWSQTNQLFDITGTLAVAVWSPVLCAVCSGTDR